MIRFLLLSILLTILFRTVSRMLNGVVRGMRGQDGSTGRTRATSDVPQRGVHMERDPICGTFVVPERAVALSTSGGDRKYFCSTDCRDKYRDSPEARPARTHGRTA